MIKKIEISTTLEVLTGMHIGGSNEFAAIGAIDNPVIRDSITRKPIIPGSSLKGKMRTLLARQLNEKFLPNKIEDDNIIVKRLFGSSKDKEYRSARLQFVDSLLINEDEIKARGALRTTEVKHENTIARITSEANPRQIERVIPGCKFEIKIIYNIYDENEMISDFENIANTFQLLEYDYLGGSGTRGYVKVKFGEVSLTPVVGDISSEDISKCSAFFKK